MARGVPDAQEDRLAPAPSPLEGLRPPRVPVHRIVRVLQEVRAGFLRESICHRAFQPSSVVTGSASHANDANPTKRDTNTTFCWLIGAKVVAPTKPVHELFCIFRLIRVARAQNELPELLNFRCESNSRGSR